MSRVAWGNYLAGVLGVEVSQGGHARRVRARLIVLLLCQSGVDGGKLALQSLHLQYTHGRQSTLSVGARAQHLHRFIMNMTRSTPA